MDAATGSGSSSFCPAVAETATMTADAVAADSALAAMAAARASSGSYCCSAAAAAATDSAKIR